MKKETYQRMKRLIAITLFVMLEVTLAVALGILLIKSK